MVEIMVMQQQIANVTTFADFICDSIVGKTSITRTFDVCLLPISCIFIIAFFMYIQSVYKRLFLVLVKITQIGYYKFWSKMLISGDISYRKSSSENDF